MTTASLQSRERLTGILNTPDGFMNFIADNVSVSHDLYGETVRFTMSGIIVSTTNNPVIIPDRSSENKKEDASQYELE
jgi:small nuclear ribonucleoprotein (snRNP)-like protein